MTWPADGVLSDGAAEDDHERRQAAENDRWMHQGTSTASRMTFSITRPP